MKQSAMSSPMDSALKLSTVVAAFQAERSRCLIFHRVGLPSNFQTSQVTFYGPRGTVQYTRNNLRGKGESTFADRIRRPPQSTRSHLLHRSKLPLVIVEVHRLVLR
jgi:hypothetical protein